MAIPSASERNARLDLLSVAVEDWALRRKQYLETHVDFAKRVLKGRTGAERMNKAMLDQASALSVDELDQFLTGL